MTRREPNVLDAIAGFIPGYRGYADRDARRTTDRLLRESVARRLVGLARDVDAVVLRLVDAGTLEGIGDLDRVKRELGACADAFRHAPAGGSGLMDDHAVTAADLDRAHRNDLEVRRQVEALAASVAQAVATGTAAALLALQPEIARIREAIARRQDALREALD